MAESSWIILVYILPVFHIGAGLGVGRHLGVEHRAGKGRLVVHIYIGVSFRTARSVGHWGDWIQSRQHFGGMEKAGIWCIYSSVRYLHVFAAYVL